MPFAIGQTYTRQQISAELGGGSVHDYLPNKDGKVLCACLSACPSGSPTKVGTDHWQLEANNYIEGAKSANSHCKSLGMSVMKDIKHEAHEDTITLTYLCQQQ